MVLGSVELGGIDLTGRQTAPRHIDDATPVMVFAFSLPGNRQLVGLVSLAVYACRWS